MLKPNFEEADGLGISSVLLLNSDENNTPNLLLMSYQMPSYSCLFENLEKDMYNYQFIKTFYFGRNSNVKSFLIQNEHWKKHLVVPYRENVQNLVG